MALIEIPYDSEGTDGWKIPIPGDGCRQFCSRDAAMAFALKLAKEELLTTAQPSYLCVEGGDGKWRLFTPDLLPVR
ncbi:MAG: hypothetical protein ABI767_03005 [Rhodanobacter sp.]